MQLIGSWLIFIEMMAGDRSYAARFGRERGENMDSFENRVQQSFLASLCSLNTWPGADKLVMPKKF